MRGLVYFAQAGDDGPIKIGFALRDVEARIRELQTANAEKLTVLRVIDAGVSYEKALHRRFAVDKIRGEWFHPSEELLRFIAEVVRYPGDPDWVGVGVELIEEGRVDVKGERNPDLSPLIDRISIYEAEGAA